MITKGASTKLDMQEVFSGDVNLNMLYKPNTKTPSTQMELRAVRIRSRTKARTTTQKESNQESNSVDPHTVQLGHSFLFRSGWKIFFNSLWTFFSVGDGSCIVGGLYIWSDRILQDFLYRRISEDNSTETLDFTWK